MWRRRTGFTAVEVLLVVVILGILAMIVIPQFKGASKEALTSRLMTNLQTIRKQIGLYKDEHNGVYPGSSGKPADFIVQMTNYTNAGGDVATGPGPGNEFPFGPYIKGPFPVNPISSSGVIRVVNDPEAAFSVPKEDGGWWFNPVTGEFKADLTDTHTFTGEGKLNML